MSPLSKITDPENIRQFKSVKDSNLNKLNDLLIANTTPVISFNNFLAIRHKGEEFELQGDLLKMITNKNYNSDLASLPNKKLLYDFAQELYFDIKAPGKKISRNRSLIRLLESPAIMASGISTIFLL